MVHRAELRKICCAATQIPTRQFPRFIGKSTAESYRIAPGYDKADVVNVNTCGFLDSAKRESLAAIGEAMVENGRVIVPGCHGVEADAIRATHPGVWFRAGRDTGAGRDGKEESGIGVYGPGQHGGLRRQQVQARKMSQTASGNS